MKKGVKFSLAFVAVVILTGVVVGLMMYTRKHPDLSGVKPDHTISASGLFSEFETNEADAGARYIGKVIEVSGIIMALDQGNSDAKSVTLDSGSPFGGIICTFQDPVSADGLVKGEEVTIRGECSGMLMDVLLNNCVLIR